jgi:hypothetical protein
MIIITMLIAKNASINYYGRPDITGITSIHVLRTLLFRSYILRRAGSDKVS